MKKTFIIYEPIDDNTFKRIKLEAEVVGKEVRTSNKPEEVLGIYRRTKDGEEPERIVDMADPKTLEIFQVGLMEVKE